jgi:hypothetical protein
MYEKLPPSSYKSDEQIQIRSDLNLMTSSLQGLTKILSKLTFGDLKFACILNGV